MNLISKGAGWGAGNGAPAEDAAAAAKQPERAIPAQPAPAWGGAGLPEERKKQVGAARLGLVGAQTIGRPVSQLVCPA